MPKAKLHTVKLTDDELLAMGLALTMTAAAMQRDIGVHAASLALIKSHKGGAMKAAIKSLCDKTGEPFEQLVNEIKSPEQQALCDAMDQTIKDKEAGINPDSPFEALKMVLEKVMGAKVESIEMGQMEDCNCISCQAKRAGKQAPGEEGSFHA